MTDDNDVTPAKAGARKRAAKKTAPAPQTTPAPDAAPAAAPAPKKSAGLRAKKGIPAPPAHVTPAGADVVATSAAPVLTASTTTAPTTGAPTTGGAARTIARTGTGDAAAAAAADADLLPGAPAVVDRTRTARVGLFVGREWSWPPAFIEAVNERDAGVVAEFAKIGAPHFDDPCPYDVLIDRISHEVPMYRAYL